MVTIDGNTSAYLINTEAALPATSTGEEKPTSTTTQPKPQQQSKQPQKKGKRR
jgi:hypothetical protein